MGRTDSVMCDLDTLQSVETTATGEQISANENKRAVAVSGATPEA